MGGNAQDHLMQAEYFLVYGGSALSLSIIFAVTGFSPLSTRPRYGRLTPSNFASLF
jgi:hypothetical protein